MVYFPTTGTILDPHDADASVDLVSYDLAGRLVENWIGYWLMDNQMPEDAFGEDWEYVEYIYAEDWYYHREVNPGRDITSAVPSSQTHPLEYGEGYVIKVTQDIDNFRWGVTGIGISGFETEESEYFTYEDAADYEVIDIMDIEDDVLEIGVYQDETCIGAVVVKDSCEQVLVYPDSTSSSDYTFEVVAGRSMAPIQDYRVYREEEATYLTGAFGRTEPYAYHRVMLGERGEGQSLIPAVLTVRGNYPNPFNPTTTISYSIPAQGRVEVSIYNVRGQLVKTLANEVQEAGEHTLRWTGCDDDNRAVSSGVYFYRVKAGNETETRKMLLLK